MTLISPGAAARAPAPSATEAARPGAFAVPGVRPSQAFAALARQHFFHMHYFQQIGPPERELGAAPREFLQRLMHALSAAGAPAGLVEIPFRRHRLPRRARARPTAAVELADRGGVRLLPAASTPALPPARTFIGGLNSYRMADRNWELGARYADANITQPALFIAGAADVVLQMIPANALEIMRRRVPDLRDVVLVPGAGHFVQQEQPQAVNAALLEFLRGL